jgi:hypothetical protein
MRYLVFAAILSLALGLQGCSSDHDSPTEPSGGANRGNWLGTITGTHAGLHLNGTCALEMNLDPAYNGRWWIDCPGASSSGEVLSVLNNGVALMSFNTTTPALQCPWRAVTTATVSTIQGEFAVDDCSSHSVVSTGTLDVRLR